MTTYSLSPSLMLLARLLELFVLTAISVALSIHNVPGSLLALLACAGGFIMLFIDVRHEPQP